MNGQADSQTSDSPLLENFIATRDLISANEVAQIFGISAKTIYSWAEKGYLPSVRMGQGRRQVVRFRWLGRPPYFRE